MRREILSSNLLACRRKHDFDQHVCPNRKARSFKEIQEGGLFVETAKLVSNAASILIAGEATRLIAIHSSHPKLHPRQPRHGSVVASATIQRALPERRVQWLPLRARVRPRPQRSTRRTLHPLAFKRLPRPGLVPGRQKDARLPKQEILGPAGRRRAEGDVGQGQGRPDRSRSGCVRRCQWRSPNASSRHASSQPVEPLGRHWVGLVERSRTC